MQITDHLYIVGGGLRGNGLSHDLDANVYAIDTGAGLVLIDAGSGLDNNALTSRMAIDGLDMRRVVAVLLTHTHFDHCGGASAIQEVSGCDIYLASDAAPVFIDSKTTLEHPCLGLTQEEARAIASTGYEWHPLPKVVGLDDGDVFSIGPLSISVHILSGHSSADVVYAITVDTIGCLFSGDIVSADRSAHKPRPDMSPHNLIESLRSLSTMSFEGLLSGHGAFCLTDRGSLIESILKDYDR